MPGAHPGDIIRGYSRGSWADMVHMADKTLDETQLDRLKDVLIKRRGDILATSTGTRALPASADVNSRQGDLADQASGTNEVHIQLKLKQTDAKILQATEEALQRMERGTYGVCRDCGEMIAPARLEAIPWTRVCIECKQKQSA
jgi:DnaK suppressor protein